MINMILLLGGFFLLVKGADFFVDGASSIAYRLRIPSVIIGLTIVALGTSAPEAAVSITAAVNGSNDIALSNIIGSNLFNLLVVTGFSAVIMPLKAEKSLMLKDYPISIVAACLLFLFCRISFFGATEGEMLNRFEGLILFILFVSYMAFLIKSTIKSRNEKSAISTSDFDTKTPVLKTSIFLTLLGVIFIVIGGQLVVKAATEIATNMGISEHIIGLSVVAVGTSLPELVTSIVAAKKGQSDIALSNVIGSNIFNILFILGLSASISPIAVSSMVIFDAGILIIASVVFYSITALKNRVGRISGFAMIISYVGYMAYILAR